LDIDPLLALHLIIGDAPRFHHAPRRAAAAWPLAADDPVAQGRNAAFLQGLQPVGWTVGQNIQIEYRWCGGNDEVISSPNERAAACASFVVNSATRAPPQTWYGAVRERHEAVNAQSASGRSCCQRVTTPVAARLTIHLDRIRPF